MFEGVPVSKCSAWGGANLFDELKNLALRTDACQASVLFLGRECLAGNCETQVVYSRAFGYTGPLRGAGVSRRRHHRQLRLHPRLFWFEHYRIHDSDDSAFGGREFERLEGCQHAGYRLWVGQCGIFGQLRLGHLAVAPNHEADAELAP